MSVTYYSDFVCHEAKGVYKTTVEMNPSNFGGIGAEIARRLGGRYIQKRSDRSR